MKQSLYFYIAVYSILLCLYLYTRIGKSFKLRAANKIALSVMFLAFTFIQFIASYDIISLQGMAMIAVFFAFLGDVFLIWSFATGGLFFMTGNVIFFVYELILLPSLNLSFADVWWFIIIFAVLYTTLVVLNLKKWIDLKDKKMPMLVYMITVTLHGSLGIALLISTSAVKITLLGLGLALFMVSDYFIILNRFKYKNNITQWCNSLTYFIGLLLVALSFMYVL